jgi:uncharacterized phiE125 gp8 family phage protein
MILTEVTTIPAAVLPVQAMKDHLRLGTGFADDGLQDALIEGYLRAAIAALEARIGKVLITRRFRWQIEAWRDGAAQALPVAPVSAISSMQLRNAAGDAIQVAPNRIRLVQDTHRPRLAAMGGALPTIPALGTAEIEFDAGFGPSWSDVPPDLAQASFLLAAEFYEHRHDAGLTQPGLPAGVTRLIERWRTVRIIGGGGR